jgi:antagonist of KipI
MLPYGEDGRVKKLLGDKETLVLPWTAPDQPETSNEVDCLMGPEWHWLTTEAQESFRHQWFEITLESDRMGYRLGGTALEMKRAESLVSSPVTFGTVQLLPNGQLIVLMADHQTTGGYPRVAQVPSADLSGLAQRKTGSNFRFRFTDLAAAEEKILSRQKYLHQLQIACKFRLEEFCSQRRDTSA